MNTAIFHSVNSGLYFWDGRDGLLIDGIHRGPETGCSSTPPSLRRQLEEGSGLFAHLTGLLFTHLHGDHFDPEGTTRLLALRPELALYSPESRRGAVSPDLPEWVDRCAILHYNIAKLPCNAKYRKEVRPP